MLLRFYQIVLYKFMPIMSFFITLQGIYAQGDTLYYDSSWRKTVKDSASFFRPPIVEEGNLYRVKDYFISGELQMDGLSKSATKDIWQGKVSWYKKDGSIYQQGNYSDGRLNGEFITFLHDKRLVAQYKNGRFSEGRQNVNYSNGANYYTEKRNDTIVEITYQSDLKGIRFERYSKGKEYDLFIKYYGDQGKFLGERQKLSNGHFDGIEVFYYYAPMRVRSINYYKRGQQFATSTYYPNGKPRELFKEDPELTKTFYDPDGKVIARMVYMADQYGLKPYQGTLINFMYGDGENAYKKSSKISYEAGQKSEDIIYYENQNIKTVTTFKPGGEKKEQIGFDEEGNEISRMEYKNYLPYNGKEILADRIAVYKEGKLIEETTFYTKTKKVFSVKTNDQERYYDIEGELLGILKLDNSENYSKPFSGTRYYQDYYGGIASFEKYEDGFVLERTSFRDRRIGDNDKKKTFKTIEIYEPGTYDKIEEINHYSNGQVQAKRIFKKYVEQTGMFYDRVGNLLGSYDYVKKEGVRYKFFADSDEVEEMEERRDGERVRFKRYTYGPNRQYGAIDPLLIEDIDVNCCASFFDRQGELIAKATYKNKKPWMGTYYDNQTNEKFTIEKGVRDGLYQKLDYNMTPLVEGEYMDGKRSGTFTTYTVNGDIKATENYKDDKLDGLSTYYDEQGKVIGEMTYSQGMPMDGTRTVSNYYRSPLTTEEYKDGKLLKKIEFFEKGKRITTFDSENSAETVVFRENSEQKRLTFSSKNGVLDGEVINYDKIGAIESIAEVNDGRLTSGTIYLASTGSDGNMKYCKLSKGEATVKLVIYGEKDKVLFKAEEHLYFGTATYYLQNLNIRMDYLTPDKLY